MISSPTVLDIFVSVVQIHFAKNFGRRNKIKSLSGYNKLSIECRLCNSYPEIGNANLKCTL